MSRLHNVLAFVGFIVLCGLALDLLVKATTSGPWGWFVLFLIAVAYTCSGDKQ